MDSQERIVSRTRYLEYLEYLQYLEYLGYLLVRSVHDVASIIVLTNTPSRGAEHFHPSENNSSLVS